jgi:erythromycin esterase
MFRFLNAMPRWLRWVGAGTFTLILLYWLLLWAFVVNVLGEPVFGSFSRNTGDYAARNAAMQSPDINRIIRLDDQSSIPDLDPIMNAIGSRAIVGVGEASHGSHEFFVMRQALLKRLIAERGFRLIGIEAGVADGHAIDQYINGAAVDLDSVMAKQKFWIYDTDEFRDIARWLRSENARRPTNLRIHLYGYDIQDFDKEARLLVEYLDSNRIEVANADMLREASFDDSEKLAALSDDALKAKITAAQAVLAKSIVAIGQQRVSDREAQQFAQYVATSMQKRLTLMSTRDFDKAYAFRDRSMAENVRWARIANANAPAMLWAHNGHIGKSTLSDTPDGAKMMGAVLSDMYRDDYIAIGMMFVSGGFVAHAPPSLSSHFLLRSFAMSMFVDVPFPLGVATATTGPDNDVMTMFAKRPGNISFIDVRTLDQSSKVRTLLEKPQPYIMPGAAYIGTGSTIWERSIVPMFDALVVFRTVTGSQNERLGTL